MNYPYRLLPQLNCKHIEFNEMHQNCFILRHTETKDIKDEYGKLRSDCLATQTDHLRDYSTNLFPNFTVEDVKIRILKSENFDYFTQLWKNEMLFKIPQHSIDFDIVDNRGLFFLRIGDISDVTFFNFDNSLPIKPMCKVIHTPINANFWHCSVRWFCGDKDSSEMTKGERRRILSVAKTFLIENACFDLTNYEIIQNIDFERITQ